jgi:hypothetical protein
MTTTTSYQNRVAIHIIHAKKDGRDICPGDREHLKIKLSDQQTAVLPMQYETAAISQTSCQQGFHYVQPIMQLIGVSIECIALALSLADNAAQTYQFFTNWVLTLDIFFGVYLVIFFERHSTVFLETTYVSRRLKPLSLATSQTPPPTETAVVVAPSMPLALTEQQQQQQQKKQHSVVYIQWKTHEQYSFVSLAWGTLFLLSLFILISVVLMAAYPTTVDTVPLSTKTIVLQTMNHIIPLFLRVLIIGLPLFQIPFLHATTVAATLFAIYNVVLIGIGTNSMKIYNLDLDPFSYPYLGLLGLLIAFAVASAFVEWFVSDIRQYWFAQPDWMLNEQQQAQKRICYHHESNQSRLQQQPRRQQRSKTRKNAKVDQMDDESSDSSTTTNDSESSDDSGVD